MRMQEAFARRWQRQRARTDAQPRHELVRRTSSCEPFSLLTLWVQRCQGAELSLMLRPKYSHTRCRRCGEGVVLSTGTELRRANEKDSFRMRAYMAGHSYSLTRILSHENYYCSITARASRSAVTKPSCRRHVLCELDAAVTACEGIDGRSEPPEVAPLADGMPRALTATHMPLPRLWGSWKRPGALGFGGQAKGPRAMPLQREQADGTN